MVKYICSINKKKRIVNIDFKNIIFIFWDCWWNGKGVVFVLIKLLEEDSYVSVYFYWVWLIIRFGKLN